MKKTRRLGGAFLCAAIVVVPAFAQERPIAASPAPLVAQPVYPNTVSLPANTEVVLRMNEELNSRRNHEHDTFSLTVASDVRLGNYVVIPAGTRATGEITWMTGRGMFGKSGKMDISFRYIELNGRQIPIEGTYRQEGEGNTVATVAGVVLVAPVVGFFITGHSAVIPQGRQLTARTREAIPVLLPDAAPLAAPMGPAAVGVTAQTLAPQPLAAQPVAVQPVAATSGDVRLRQANTQSGVCIDAPPEYRGTGSRTRPAVTSAMPLCRSLTQ